MIARPMVSTDRNGLAMGCLSGLDRGIRDVAAFTDISTTIWTFGTVTVALCLAVVRHRARHRCHSAASRCTIRAATKVHPGTDEIRALRSPLC
jgi:hypothetical protein